MDLPDVEAAHKTAVDALADGIQDIALEGATDLRFAVEVRDGIGRVLEVSANLGSKIFRTQ